MFAIYTACLNEINECRKHFMISYAHLQALIERKSIYVGSFVFAISFPLSIATVHSRAYAHSNSLIDSYGIMLDLNKPSASYSLQNF